MLNKLFSKHAFLKVKEHKIFQSIVIVAIILSAFLVGASTFKISDTLISIFWFVDILITLFFIIEIIIRFIAEPNKKKFLKNGWNLFDTLIVFISIIPIGPNSSILVFRLLRIFRVLRLISAVPELKELIEALLLSIKRVFYVSLLLFIILYIVIFTLSKIFYLNNSNLKYLYHMVKYIRIINYLVFWNPHPPPF